MAMQCLMQCVVTSFAMRCCRIQESATIPVAGLIWGRQHTCITRNVQFEHFKYHGPLADGSLKSLT